MASKLSEYASINNQLRKFASFRLVNDIAWMTHVCAEQLNSTSTSSRSGSPPRDSKKRSTKDAKGKVEGGDAKMKDAKDAKKALPSLNANGTVDKGSKVHGYHA